MCVCVCFTTVANNVSNSCFFCVLVATRHFCVCGGELVCGVLYMRNKNSVNIIKII